MKKALLYIVYIFILLVSLISCRQAQLQEPDVPAPSDSQPQANQSLQQPAAELAVSEVSVSDESNYSAKNGGTFAKVGDILVYTGDYNTDIYALDISSGDCRKLAVCDSVARLYFDGEYVYYVPSYYMGRGIYRVDLNGNEQTISEQSSLQLWLTDDKIYYTQQIGFDDINQTPQGNLCVMDKDGSNGKTLITDVKNQFALQGNFIYYTDLNSRSLMRADLNGENRTLIAEGRTYLTVAADNHVCYIDYNQGETHHLVNLATGENTILGRFGRDIRLNGQTYIYTRREDASGIPELPFTLFRIDDDTLEATALATLDTSIDMPQYLFGGWAYFYGTVSSQTVPSDQTYHTYRINLETGEIQPVIDLYPYYLDGYGYAPSPAGAVILDLSTGQSRTIAKEESAF